MSITDHRCKKKINLLQNFAYVTIFFSFVQKISKDVRKFKNEAQLQFILNKQVLSYLILNNYYSYWGKPC